MITLFLPCFFTFTWTKTSLVVSQEVLPIGTPRYLQRLRGITIVRSVFW